jgi:aspartate/methionine/tyrosine aminotransferase
MNFAAFRLWREQRLRANPDLLDCGETNLYRSLAFLQPRPDTSSADRSVHRCDLARSWLNRYGFPASGSGRALVCRGVRHALTLIFRELARADASLVVPDDVYPVYWELARAAGIEPRGFATLPKPEIPATHANGRAEYLLIANPWKPLGRFLTDEECAALICWLGASRHRHLLVDCVYDLDAPLHATTQMLRETGRAILLHSFTKGWLWPQTFGVALIGEGHAQFESAFRCESPAPAQLRLAESFLSTDANCPGRVVISLRSRAEMLLAALPDAVSRSLVTDPARLSPGSYFFPVGIQAEELLREHHLLAIPGAAFGAAGWDGSIITSLSAAFAPVKDGSAQ